MKVVKADLVPTTANLRERYASFAELCEACESFGTQINARPHRETGRAPVDLLAEERSRLHLIPVAAFTAALGQTRMVAEDQPVRFGSVRYYPWRGGEKLPKGRSSTPRWRTAFVRSSTVPKSTIMGPW